MGLAKNQTFNEDCLKTMSRMDDGEVDLIITSPPYDDLRNYKGFTFDYKKTFDEMYRVLKNGGILVWVIGDASYNGDESGTSFTHALYAKSIGFKLLDTMIWNKGSFAFPAKNTYHQVFDYMFVFTKGKPTTTNFICDRKNLYVGSRGASGRNKDGERNTGKSTVRNEYGKRFNIWNYPIGGGHSASDKIAYEHPAIFPEQLAEDHILSWSNEGDTVYDPFMGSGTVAKMAKKNNRLYIGSEISAEYCDIIKRRLNEE